MSRRRIILAAAICALACVSRGAGAKTFPAPTSDVLLTVDGNITHSNVGGEARFDRRLLEDLGTRTLTTWTPWTEGEVVFEGVAAAAVLRAVDARGTEVVAAARNDYAVSIPIADFERWPVLIAMKMNGQPLRLRDRGPLWVVYPWSGFAELDGPESRTRSIWQLVRMTVR